MLQFPISEGVLRPQGDDVLEGFQMGGVVTDGILELDVDGLDIVIDGILGLLSGGESTSNIAVPLLGAEE